MVSLQTNVAAMTALQTLQATNSSMDTTQNRVATGLKVASASDNAAYWSIATTMRSDSKAMSAVVDALGLGAATVDTAYTAVSAIKDSLDEIKAKLVVATGESVDRSKVQDEITGLITTLATIADSASFSGSNVVAVDGTGTTSVTAGFSRKADGGISLSTIDIDSRISGLINLQGGLNQTAALQRGAQLTAGQSAFDGLLAAGKGLDVSTAPASTASSGPGNAATLVFSNPGGPVSFGDTAISFDITVTEGGTKQNAKTVVLDRYVVDQALHTSDGVIASTADYVKVFNKALENAGLSDLTMGADGRTISGPTDSAVAGDKIEFANLDSFANGNTFSLGRINVADADRSRVDFFLRGLEKMISLTTDSAAYLGTVKTRIDRQLDFTTKLIGTIDKGIGTLVDADMTEESTRLKALQTQQQLGVQALSIANASAQSVMTLFR